MARPALPPARQTSLATRSNTPPLLAAARAALARVGNKGQAVARSVGGAVARTARRAAPVAKESLGEVVLDEAASFGAHASAHAADARFGPAAGWIAAGVELVAMIAAKALKPRWVSGRRALRSMLRGSLHHKLGVGLHQHMPLRGGKASPATAGAEPLEEDQGEGPAY